MSKLVEWIPRLKSAFAHTVPFASAMNWTTPYAESNETFPNFEQYIAGESGGGQPPSGPSAGAGTGGNGGASASAGASASSSGSVSRQSASPTASGAQGAASSSRAAAGRVEAGVVGFGGALLAGLMAWATL